MCILIANQVEGHCLYSYFILGITMPTFIRSECGLVQSSLFPKA